MQFQIGSKITCGSGVKLSKFYYYDYVTDSCLAEIACPVPIEDTSRGNRFFSRISCLKLCKKPNQLTNCHMQPETGPCNRYVRRYYYNTVSGKCRSFNYSGCEGNNNNFNSFLTCQDACSEASKVNIDKLGDKCQMPKDTGKFFKSACYHILLSEMHIFSLKALFFSL